MRLRVSNVPRLAGEEALRRWFLEAGLRVESVHFIPEESLTTSCRACFVEIGGAGIPPKDLRHLTKRSFWGRPLVVRPAALEAEKGQRSDLKLMFSPTPN